MKLFLVFIAALYAGTLAQNVNLYSVGAVIPWTPKAPSSVDQSTVYNGMYYLADRTNAGVHVVNLQNNTQTTLIKGFTTTLVNGSVSSTASGPDGLVVLPDRNELWVGNGDGTVKVISLKNNTIIDTITTGSKKRADEFSYDPKKGIVIVTNPDEDTPYVSVMNAATRAVLGKVTFQNASGLEQPTYDSASGTFYVSVPSTDAYPDGCISTLNITSMSIQNTFKLPPCIPAGIVFGPNQNLFVSCSQDQILTYGYAASYVISGVDGSVIANISGVAGVDQVAYDPTAKLYYASAYQMLVNGSTPSPFVAVVNATSNKLVQTFPTDNKTAHSVAVDSKTNAMYIPIAAKGIQMYRFSGSSSSSGNGTTATGSPVASHTSSGAVPQVNVSLMSVLGLLSLIALVARL